MLAGCFVFSKGLPFRDPPRNVRLSPLGVRLTRSALRAAIAIPSLRSLRIASPLPTNSLCTRRLFCFFTKAILFRDPPRNAFRRFAPYELRLPCQQTVCVLAGCFVFLQKSYSSAILRATRGFRRLGCAPCPKERADALSRAAGCKKPPSTLGSIVAQSPLKVNRLSDTRRSSPRKKPCRSPPFPKIKRSQTPQEPRALSVEAKKKAIRGVLLAEYDFCFGRDSRTRTYDLSHVKRAL